MDLGVAGKVALVTAATKGLGLASARALAGEGAKVLICGRNQETLARALESLRSTGGDVAGVAADITEADAPARLVREAVERYGGLDILVANAGGPPPARALDVSDEQMMSAVNANLITSVRLIREARPHMEKAGWGRICCITSVAVKQPIPELALSNLARTGLWAWAKTASRDLAGSGLTLNLACPGHHATDRMIQLGGTGPMGDPEDFGKVVAFLCSAPAAYITGTAVVVDGGMSQALV